MEKGEIIETLTRWNFWKKQIDTGIDREYADEILDTLKYNKVTTVLGVRRAGKSYILRQVAKKLIRKGVAKEDILIVNFEEPKFENAELKLLLKIYESFKEIIGPKGKPYIFLDEIQEVKKWEKFVRSLNETKEAYIIVTGSSSKLMSSELATVLTGRQLTFDIFPLSFKEFLLFNGVEIKTQKDIYLNADGIKKHFYRYVETGAFPEVVLTDSDEIKRKIITDYYDTIINRDIVKRYRIREIEKIRILARYYITNVSSPITYRRISRFLKIPTETVSRFSDYLQSAKLIFFITKFSFSLKEQENSPRKVYCIDNGLFTSIGFRFRENVGKLMENLVAIELQRRKTKNHLLEVYYWKDHQHREVDFVVKRGQKIEQLIQVCYNLEDFNTREREIKALLKASKELKCRNLLIITEDKEGVEKVKGEPIKYIPLWKWLMEND
jgi:hypothetical protein